jgi:hypothetical protein
MGYIAYIRVQGTFLKMNIPSNFVQVHNAFSLRYKRIETFHHANLFENTIFASIVVVKKYSEKNFSYVSRYASLMNLFFLTKGVFEEVRTAMLFFSIRYILLQKFFSEYFFTTRATTTEVIVAASFSYKVIFTNDI